MLRAILAAVLFTNCSVLWSQVDTTDQRGIQPFHSYDFSKIDSVDLATGNLSLHIPLVSYKEVGTLPNLEIDLVYNRVEWDEFSSDPTNSEVFWGIKPSTTPSANGNFTAEGVLPTRGHMYYYSDTNPIVGDTEIFYNVAVDSSGASHVGGANISGTNVTTSPIVSHPGLAETIDGTGLRISISPTSSTITDPSGIRYGGSCTLEPNQSCDHPIEFVSDPSGNTIITNNNGSGAVSWTDPQGRTVPSPRLTAGGCVTYSYLAHDDASLPTPYIFCSSMHSITTQFPDDGLHAQQASANVSMLDSVTLPNLTKWTFTYDTWGELTSIGLPTGGAISYTWGSFLDWTTRSFAINSPNERRVVTKTISDGSSSNTWNYNYLGSTAGTVVTEPTLISGVPPNDTLHLFGGGGNSPYLDVETDYFEGAYTLPTYSGCGSYPSAPHLKMSVLTTYQTTGGFTQVPLNGLSGSIAKTRTTVLDTGQASRISYDYDFLNSWTDDNLSLLSQPVVSTPFTHGNALTTIESDYGQCAPGSTIRTTTNDYKWIDDATGNYLINNLLAIPSSIAVTGNLNSSLTTYAYDESNGSPSGVFGNNTSVTRAASPTNSVRTSTVFNTQGMPTSQCDANGNPCTTITYQCGGALPYQVTNPAGQTTQYGYDCNTGLLTAVKDPNDLAASRSGTTYQYTAMADISHIGYSDAGSVSADYHAYATPLNVTTTTTATPNPTLTASTQYDGLARPTVQTSANGATVTTLYDGVGRILAVSNPQSTTSFSTDGWTSFAYDALGRKRMQCQPDNGTPAGSCSVGSATLQVAYSGNTITTTDEDGVSSKNTKDALGRLTSVKELGSTASPLNLLTEYTYDVLGNLWAVNQHGTTSEVPRARNFTYDSLSRLITAFNPETKTVCYGQWSNSSCTSGYDANGNLIYKTDARLLTTKWIYDSINRVTDKQSLDGSFHYSYQYDASGHGASIGRLTLASNNVNSAYAQTYDPMGRVTKQQYCLPSDYSYGTTMQVAYDLAGKEISATYPDGRVVNRGWNSSGFLDHVMDSASGYQYLTTQSTYYPNGVPQIVWSGNGVATGWVLNHRQQIWARNMVRIGSSAPGSYSGINTFQAMEYCYGPSVASPSASNYPGCSNLGHADNGNVWQIIDGRVSGHTQTFTYDSLNRLSSFLQTDSSMQQTYAYDSFGNLNQIAPGTLQSNVSPLPNNQLQGVGYDDAGNTKSVNNGMFTTLYSYDGEGKLVDMNGGAASYTYDADGARVRKSISGGAFTEYVSFNGQTVVEKYADGTWTDYIFANGVRLARADNYDVRIHLSGTNCSNCGSNPNMFAGVTSLTAANGYVVRTGDLLTWRQYQHGSALGGMIMYFTDGSTANGIATDSDGQPISADSTMDNWHLRTVDLSAFAGKTVLLIDPFDYTTAPAGPWDIYYGDISLISADASVISLYSRNTLNLSVSTNPNVSGLSAITEKASDSNPITTVTFYHGDSIGSTRLTTNAAGWLQSSDNYYPFGQQPAPSSSPNHFKFTGKERDTESGLDNFGPRYYGSNMGRFMSPDEFGGHLEDPQTLNKYAYVGNNPLSRTDPTGHDFWQSCDKASASCGNQQIGTNKDGSAINHLVQGTTDSNGNFSSTVVTSASLGQAGSGNSATVNGNGVMVTSSTGTAQGIFINGTPSATIQGDANSPGWSQFSFHIDSNDAFHGVLNAGEATYNGGGGHDGMVSAIEALKVNGKGPFSYTEEMFGNPFHPGASNFRFTGGDHPEMFNYGPSPHFAVPKAGTSSDFHTDSKTGPAHLSCALGGVGCY